MLLYQYRRPSRIDVTKNNINYMAKKHHVHFTALEKVKEPVVVNFKTNQGKEIKFPAHKKVLEEVQVEFMAKGKKK